MNFIQSPVNLDMVCDCWAALTNEPCPNQKKAFCRYCSKKLS